MEGDADSVVKSTDGVMRWRLRSRGVKRLNRRQAGVDQTEAREGRSTLALNIKTCGSFWRGADLGRTAWVRQVL